MNINTYAEKHLLPVLAAFLCSAAGAVFLILDAPVLVAAAPLYFLLVVLFWFKRDWAIFALLLSSFCTAIAVEFGPVTLRPDQLITIAIAPSIFISALSGG